MIEDRKVDGVEYIDMIYTRDGYELSLTRDDGDGVIIDLDSDTFEDIREVFMLKDQKD